MEVYTFTQREDVLVVRASAGNDWQLHCRVDGILRSYNWAAAARCVVDLAGADGDWSSGDDCHYGVLQAEVRAEGDAFTGELEHFHLWCIRGYEVQVAVPSRTATPAYSRHSTVKVKML